jgi:hypothetical protein
VIWSSLLKAKTCVQHLDFPYMCYPLYRERVVHFGPEPLEPQIVGLVLHRDTRPRLLTGSLITMWHRTAATYVLLGVRHLLAPYS